MPVRQPKVVVVYIGSNDLSAADCGDAGESALRSVVKPLLARRAAPGSASGASPLRGAPHCDAVQPVRGTC